MQSYHVNKRIKYIRYLNENNLYDWAMSQCLPYGGFKWLNQKEMDKFDIKSIESHYIDEYILVVHLEYSDELHELNNDFLLAPEKHKINHDM